MPEDLNKLLDEVEQILLQKRVEKGAKTLLNEINDSFIKTLTSLNDRLRDTVNTLKEIAQEGKIDKKEILEAIKSIKLEPRIDVGVPTFNIPPIVMPEFPKITVPRPSVIVNPPEINIPAVKMPKEMKVSGLAAIGKAIISAITGKLNVGLGEIDTERPLPVILVDQEGNYVRPATQVVQMTHLGRRTDIGVGTLVGTGNGTTTTFTLPYTPSDPTEVVIFVGGAPKFLADDFSITGNQITFTSAPRIGVKIRILAIK